MRSEFKITSIDKKLKDNIISKINNKTKPLGSLGKLEDIALQLAQIQSTLSPTIQSPTLIIFAGDHGIASEGVSPYPQDVTWQMVLNFISGGAAINILAEQLGWDLKIIDAGVNHDFELSISNISKYKIAKGTKNYLQEKAMSHAQMQAAIAHGATIANEVFLTKSNCIAFGEMGISNTSSAALIMHKILKIPLQDCVGKGTGLDEIGLKNKVKILTLAADLHKDDDALEILECYGGFEIAMIVGAILKSAENKICIVIDGFIVTAAVLIAHKLYPAILDYCIFAHQSDENGHKKMLEFLKVTPILNLNMRLGEGSGAAMALPILQASVNFLNNMASFEDAGVSKN